MCSSDLFSLLVDDEEIVLAQENIKTNRRKKQKISHSEKIMENNEGPSENSKGSREVITSEAHLEDDIINKTKCHSTSFDEDKFN